MKTKLKIIDLNGFTNGIWKNKYLKKLTNCELLRDLKQDDSINFIEERALGRIIYHYGFLYEN